ncbi:hypothetical protein [Veillonella sp.]|uniref:hypothetical protein n=1 Tax=Veillonella sp. TaxID=1926307 RepID=UPI0025E92102|nr:hypothetical protein [Veillonella sp.]
MMQLKQWLRPLILGLVVQLAVVMVPNTALAAWLNFEDMYAGATSEGLILSDSLLSLNGQNVTMQGYMAPPLKPTINFFVLTETPMDICPFCSTDADWPSDIVVVYMDDSVTALPYDQDITVSGQLEVGSYVDGETGFVSLVRLRGAEVY